MTSPASPTTTTPEPTETVTPPPRRRVRPTLTASAAVPHRRRTSRRPGRRPRRRPTHRPTGLRQGGWRRRVRARRSPDVRAGARSAATSRGRHQVAAHPARPIVWFACLLAATALLLGAVLVVLDANTRNALVEAVLRAADWADLGVFIRTAGIKQFTGDGATVKNAITNWGLAAVAWLVVGRVARRILTPCGPDRLEVSALDGTAARDTSNR